MSRKDSNLSNALRIAARGLPVFPCGPHKGPITRHGFKDATTDPEQIRAWWKKDPDALIGCPMGEVTGLVVLDVDVDKAKQKDGEASLSALEKEHGKLPKTLTVSTPRGGRHLYFKYPGERVRTLTDHPAPALDIRADGGYVILPPSPGYSKSVEAAPAEMPVGLLKLIQAPKGRTTERVSLPSPALPLTDTEDQNRVREALTAIPANDYDTWVKVGMAIHSEFPGGEGFAMFDTWSGTSPEKYDQAAVRSTWSSFKEERAGSGVKLGTLFELAKAGGWSPYTTPRPRLGGKQVQAAPPPVEALEEMLHDEEGADRFQPFPADVLPEPHRSLVIEGARSIGCDPSLVALPLLASTAAAIGNARRVEIKAGWTEPAVLWCVPVALSGDGKSPAFDAGTDGLNHIEDREHSEYLAAVEEHKRELQAWKDAGSEGPKPEPPTAIRHVVRDTTVEGLALLLADSPRGLLLARDELAAWVGGFDRYQGGRGEESAHWLEFYRAGRVSVDRKSGEPRHIHIRRAAVSITGTIQPATLERLLEQKHFETGLAARLLLAHPPRTPRRWNEGELSSALLERVRAVFERLTGLPMGTDEHGQPAPVDLPFTEAAKVRWIRFFNEHAEEAEGLEDARLLSAWSKLEGTAARFALILQLIEDPESPAVDLPALERGLVLLDWFKHETRRIYGQLAESVEFRDCKAVLDAIRKRGGVAKVRELYKSGVLNSDRERVERTLDLLAGRGLGKWEEIPTGTGGGRPTREFHISESYPPRQNPKTPKPQNGVSGNADTTPLPKPDKTPKPHPKQGDTLPDETAKTAETHEKGGSVSSGGFGRGVEGEKEGGGFGVLGFCPKGGGLENPETPQEGTL